MSANKKHQRPSSASSYKLARSLNGDSDLAGSSSGALLVADNQKGHKSVWTRPGVPSLFLVICFIIIANTSCDPVGGATPGKKTDNKNQVGLETDNNLATRTTTAIDRLSANKRSTSGEKYDPLSMLREIYLDHDSKVITMILPPQGGEPASTYHPNLRYGRRSMANVAEPASAHTEFGKLTFNNLGPLKSPLQQRPEGSSQDNNVYRSGANVYQLVKEHLVNSDGGVDDSGLNNYQAEIGKLLKCNYTGMSNLYWCDTGASK